MDGFLQNLIKIVELGLLGVRIWIAIPGGIVHGELISCDRFLEEFGERFRTLALNRGTGDVLEEISYSE